MESISRFESGSMSDTGNTKYLCVDVNIDSTEEKLNVSYSIEIDGRNIMCYVRWAPTE